MFKLHSICFTTNKKAHYLAIDYANVLQIENDVSAVRLELKEPFNSAIAGFSIRPLRTNTVISLVPRSQS
jgi:hypothetical protein